MKIQCDLCQQAVEDSLLQIFEQGSDILYVCPDCFAKTRPEPPEEQP